MATKAADAVERRQRLRAYRSSVSHSGRQSGAGAPRTGPHGGLTVRVSDREVRSLISNGYLSLERSEAAAAVAIALEAWIADNVT